MKYYIKHEDETHGPFPPEHIRERISEKVYQASDLIRPEDSDHWTALGEIVEFKDTLALQAPLKNSLATGSLILAFATPLMLLLASLLGSPFLFLMFLVTGITAIISGHLAIRKTMRSLQDMEGYRLAKASLWLSYTAVVIMVFAPLLPLFYHPPENKVDRAINNCKQIIISLRLYASDHDGKYPDFMAPNAHNSNEVFRLLFKDEILETERVFGCGRSPYKPDGNIGTAPDFLEAVKPGENHWAMTKGLTDAMDGSIPLVFENPSDGSWPPKWNANDAKAMPGRAWSGGKVVIGFNDGSVEVLKLDSDKGTNIGLKPKNDGTPIFPVLDPKLEILNVAK